MIYFIKGKIIYKNKDSVVIESYGLGYKIFVTDFLLEKIKIDKITKIFTFLAIKQETTELYGFEKRNELKYFKLLKSISGIGPKSAINILSLVKINDLERAILDENITILTKVSGVGTKNAQKIILELKGKIEKITSQGPKPEDDTIVIDALIGMGYTLTEARQTIKKIPSDILEIKKRIKQALKILSGR